MFDNTHELSEIAVHVLKGYRSRKIVENPLRTGRPPWDDRRILRLVITVKFGSLYG